MSILTAEDEKTILYAADVTPLKNEALYASAYAAVPEERRRRADRYVRADARFLSIGAALLLKKALAEAGVFDAEFGFGEYGKPYLKNRGDVFFNVSHSGDYVFCAVSNRELGCDIERIREVDLALAERFFRYDEYASVAAAVSPGERSVLFARYWTLKESFIKAAGCGLNLSLRDFRIVLSDDGACVEQRLDSRNYYFREYDLIPGYRCAVCTVDAKCGTEPVLIDIAETI